MYLCYNEGVKRNIDYTAGNLRAFALNYDIQPTPYISENEFVIDPWPILDFRLDFNTALASLDSPYRQLVEADIVGAAIHHQDMTKLKHAYNLMAKFLNS